MILRDLAWLVELAEQRHVTEAAAVLGTSQPTLSRALARVEAEVGTRLFERTADGVHPNPDGELVVAAAREVTGRWDRLTADLAERLDPERGLVRLAFLDSMATSLVPRLLRDFHAHAPLVRVVLRQEPAHDILRDLMSGAAELAVTSPRIEGDFGWLPLQEERLVLVVPPTHRLRERRRVSLSELAGEEMVTTPLGFGSRAQTDALMAEAGVSLRISFESADLATIEGLVAAGLGIALLPQAQAAQSGSVAIPLATPTARRVVGLTWRTDREQAPAAARFLAFVTAAVRSGSLGPRSHGQSVSETRSRR